MSFNNNKLKSSIKVTLDVLTYTVTFALSAYIFASVHCIILNVV